jgi:hypothetical protein
VTMRRPRRPIAPGLLAADVDAPRFDDAPAELPDLRGGLEATRVRSPAGRSGAGRELVPGTPPRARRIPRALRACPQCGSELTKRQLKLALIDRLDQAAASSSKAALELMRKLFPEDTVTPANGAAAALEAKRQRELYPE